MSAREGHRSRTLKRSAGTLLYRHVGEGDELRLEVLLVHPSGNYNRRAPWGIPKGLIDEGETSEQAARRETEEETGVRPAALLSLGTVDYTKSRKRIEAFAGRAPADAAPRCASWEVDAAEFLPVETARVRIHPDQGAFIDRLLAVLTTGPDAGS
ncbi:MAG: NUDIX domain-containing protein [Myxococcota bacterium]